MNPIKALKSNQRLNEALVLSWMAAIFLSSSIPSDEVPSLGFDYSIPFHLIEYSVLGLLVYSLFMDWRRGLNYAIILCAFYAFSD